MTAKQKPKRRHHHVWQHYLRSWATNGAIWCLQNGKVFSSGTTAVAVEKDFYKFPKLSTADIRVIQLLFAESHPAAQKSALSLIGSLMTPYRLFVSAPGAVCNEEIVKDLSEYESNVLEDLHAQVEADFIPLLHSALEGDISFYSDERCVAFVDYLTKQYMRTKGIKARVTEQVQSIGEVDLGRLWSLLSFLMAQNVGATFYVERRRRKLALLTNDTLLPFITGDQPVINLQAAMPRTEKITLFYPLSPRLAMWLGEVDEECPFPEFGMLQQHVTELNSAVAKAAYQQIYASDPIQLKQFIQV